MYRPFRPSIPKYNVRVTVTLLIAVLIVAALSVLLQGWGLMLILGALHSAFPNVPNLAFGWCALISFGLALFGI